MVDLHQARLAKLHLQQTLAGRGDVRGVGIGATDDGYRLLVSVAEAGAAPLPSEVEGVPVHVRVVGRVRAQSPRR